MTRAQWEIVEPLFKHIRERAYLMARHGASIVSDVSALPVVPDYETKARALMDAAEKDLSTALYLLREARDIYDRKPASPDPVYLDAAE